MPVKPLLWFVSLLAFLLLPCDVIHGDDGLSGKVMCGYQGWFRAPMDGTNCGWHHYSKADVFDPANCAIDLWPDVRELPPSARIDTDFRFQDGTVAQVFSSTNSDVVDLHFKWMKNYSIDGVFLQRFAVTTRDEKFRKSMDAVLGNVQCSAAKHGRKWVLMYDLTGLKTKVCETVIDDWSRLNESHGVSDRSRDSSYLSHREKPLIALWGLGFSDRDPMLDEWGKLIDFFHSEGCSVMVGVPTWWRTLKRDAIEDPRLHEVISKVDVLSPWTVGRYDSPDAAAEYANKTLRADIQWCQDRNIDYLPVAFPGFSWQNLSRMRGETSELDQIKRRGGEFLWSQFWNFRKHGAQMIYVAMFDEMDEATAIMKFSKIVPTGASDFLSEASVPNDQYLWLTGVASRMLKGLEELRSEKLPTR